MEEQIAKVEMGFLHLQQNIDIPEINLIIHPVVLQMIEKAKMEDCEPCVKEVDDVNLLNNLHNGVNHWVREILKVSRLDRDPSTGTASQEISFWLSLECVLKEISKKCKSPEVTLTLDILRYHRRFTATSSFDSTGLNKAIETAENHCLFMKDFPLDELMSATEFEKITKAIQSIFSHLKKIRNSCMFQLLKVLYMKRIMVISLDDFEKTMGSLFAVFTTWNNEYENLQVTLKDLANKSFYKEKFYMAKPINLSHTSNQLHKRLIIIRK